MRMIYLLLRVLLFAPLYGVIVPLTILRTKRPFRAARPVIVGNLHYGANYIHAKHLAIWYFVRTNSDLEEAKGNGLEQAVQAETRRFLALYRYPKSVLSEVHIGLESRENIDKGGGNWRFFQ